MATSNVFLIIFQIFLFLITQATILDVFLIQKKKKSANKTNLENKHILNT